MSVVLKERMIKYQIYTTISKFFLRSSQQGRVDVQIVTPLVFASNLPYNIDLFLENKLSKIDQLP